MVDNYITGYKTKGRQSNPAWQRTFKAVENEVMALKGGESSMFRVVTAMTRAVSKSTVKSKDEACFQSSGGELTFSTTPVKSCSINNVSLDEIEGKKKSFTHRTMKKEYEERDDEESMNYYRFVSRAGAGPTGEPVAPQFLGIPEFMPWPLTERYCQDILQIFKPYRGTHELGSLAATGSPFRTWVAEFEAFAGDHQPGSTCPARVQADWLAHVCK